MLLYVTIYNVSALKEITATYRQARRRDISVGIVTTHVTDDQRTVVRLPVGTILFVRTEVFTVLRSGM